MVVLMVAVTILTVLTAAALPMWSHATKREKEAELISRGWQYAEAIRVFQQRHGRLPTRLEELIEVKPRSIRRLWEDPMTESGEWGLVFQGAGALPTGQGTLPTGPGSPPGGRGNPPEDDGRDDRRPGPRAPRPGEQRTVGPIVGVRSLSDEEAATVLFGEESYDRWQFTVERLTGAQGQGQGQGQGQSFGIPRQAQGQPTLPRAKWLGRPFRPGLEAPQGGGMPGGGAGQPIGPDGRARPGGRGQQGRDLAGGRSSDS